MPKTRRPYPPEYRERMIELVRSGRSPESLAREFEPSAQCIRNWVRAGRSRRRPARGRPDDRRARGVAAAPPRECDAPRGAGDPEKSRGLVRAGDRIDPVEGFRFVKANQAAHSIATMCRVLGVSASGYYAWQRPRRERAERRTISSCSTQIRAFHRQSRGTYGAPRIHGDLRAAGVRVGRKRVARLIKQAGLRGVSRRKWPVTTVRARAGPAGARPGAAGVHGDRPESALGRRHHLHPDLGGLPVSGGRPRCLESPDRRLGDGDAPAHRARPRGARHGDRAAPADGGDPSLGPGLPVHGDRVRPPLPRGARAARRWARSATATTTRCARASSRRSSASCSTA